MKDFFKTVVWWFVISVMVTTTIWFVGSVLLGFDINYRTLFWLIFGAVVILDFTLYLFLVYWMREYKKQIRSGKTRKSAFESACENIKFRPPRALLKIIEPVLYKISQYLKK